MTAPKTGKGADHQRIILSAAQENPNLAEPDDFEVLQNGGLGGSETLPFDNSCGSTLAEYRQLLKKGRAGNKFAFTELDDYGRALKE